MMNSKQFLKLTAGLLVSVFALICVACSSDEDGTDAPEVTLTPKETLFVTYASKGKIELPVQLTGVSTSSLPNAKLFSILSTSIFKSSFVYEWDTYQGMPVFGDDPTFTVESLRSGDGENEYILTIAYNMSGNMESTYKFNLYYGDTTVSTQEIKVENYAYAQETVSLELQEYAYSASTSLIINIRNAFQELGIAASDYNPATREIYCGYEGGEPDGEEWSGYDNVFVGFSFGNEAGPGLSVLGCKNLEPGKKYFMQLIISQGDGKYKAVHVPFTLTE